MNYELTTKRPRTQRKRRKFVFEGKTEFPKGRIQRKKLLVRSQKNISVKAVNKIR